MATSKRPPAKKKRAPAPAATAVDALATSISLDLDVIYPSASNPRRALDEETLRGLASSIGQHGVIQPILVRPRAHEEGGWEIVCGERRWRAARMAGLRAIPARSCGLSDGAVLEIQLAENDQREDVSPVELAAGLRALVDVHGVPVEEIAARLGRDVRYVHRRLQLTRLVPEAAEALSDERIPLGIAELLAGLARDVQASALSELLEDADGYVPTIADARDLIRRRYLRRLAQAPFDVARADLVEGAPACGRCPSRTSAQAELFAERAEGEGDDSCTDGGCWAAKTEAAWAIERERALAAGVEVLAEDAEVSRFTGLPAGWWDASEAAWGDDAGRTARDIAEEHGLPLVLGKRPDGSAVYGVDSVSLRLALAEETAGEGAELLERARAGRVAEEVAQRAVERMERIIIAAAGAGTYPPGLWAAVARRYVGVGHAQRRGMTVGELRDTCATLPDLELIAMICESAHVTADHEWIAALARILGVDLEVIRIEAEADLSEISE